MSNTKKKIYPKFKKKLKGFLTDESGKITKKDALGLAAGAALLSGAEVATAGHLNFWNPGLLSSAGITEFVSLSSAECSHASGIVNGHYSSNPTLSTTSTTYAHANHDNHGSGGWC